MAGIARPGGALFTTFYHDCHNTINAVFDVHGDDQTHDNNASSFGSFNTM